MVGSRVPRTVLTVALAELTSDVGSAVRGGSDPLQCRILPWTPNSGSMSFPSRVLDRLHSASGLLFGVDVRSCGSVAALMDWAIDGTAVTLAELSIPLVLDLHGGAEVAAAHDLAARIPTLNIIVRRAVGCPGGLTLALLESSPNIRVASAVLNDKDLAWAIQLNPKQVVFGSAGTPSVEHEIDRLVSVAPAEPLSRVLKHNAFDLLRLHV